MTWQNLLPSSLGNPSSNKKFLSTKEAESKSPNPTSSAPYPQSKQPPTDIKKGGAIILPVLTASKRKPSKHNHSTLSLSPAN